MIDDLLAPQKMASTGGADASRGLARQLGLGRNNENKVKAGLEVLEPNEFVQFKNDIDGTGDNAKNLFRPLFDKSESIIKKVFGTYKRVGKDADAVTDIQQNLSLNKTNQKGERFLDDSQLEDAFTQTNQFLDKYDNQVSGAFPNRFGRANAPDLAPDNISALGEIKAAEDILDGRTTLGNGVQLRGLPDAQRGQTNPEYFATMLDGSTRLVEVKTPTGNPSAITRNLNGAIKQIAGSPLRQQVSKNAYIRIDYSNGKPGREDFFFGKIEGSLNTTVIDNQPITPGTQLVEYVELLYKDSTNNNQVTKMLVRVENGIPNIFRGN